MILQAFKSKLVWLGILEILGGLAHAYLEGGVTPEAVTAALTGIATIVLRAMTTKPLEEK